MHMFKSSTKAECDYLYGWIIKTVTYAQISPKMVNPRDIARERRRRKMFKRLLTNLVHVLKNPVNVV